LHVSFPFDERYTAGLSWNILFGNKEADCLGIYGGPRHLLYARIIIPLSLDIWKIKRRAVMNCQPWNLPEEY
jgi:hypothetical protein